MLPLKSIDAPYEEEYSKRNDREINDGVDEDTIIERNRTSFLRIDQGAIGPYDLTFLHDKVQIN